MRQERQIFSIRLPSIEPDGEPMMATVDLTIGYSNLNQPVDIKEPARNDTSPLMTPRPDVAPVVGPAGAPASSTGPGPATGRPGAGGPTTQPAQVPQQAPAQV